MYKANTDWENWELDCLKEQYPSMGIRIPELMHRTPTAIIHMAGKLKVRRLKNEPNTGEKTREPWEQWELDILLDDYCYYGTSIPRLKHRTRAGIQAQAQKYDVRYEWKLKTTKEER